MKRKFFSSLLMLVFTVASVGMFVSCKDYDDDITNVNGEVSSLRSDLESVKAGLEQSISAAQSNYDTEIAKINAALENAASDEEVTNLKDALAELERSYLAKLTSLEEQLRVAQEALEAVEANRVQEALNAYAALSGDLEKAASDIEAIQLNLQMQQEALAAYMQKIADAGYTDIDGLLQALQNAEATLADVMSSITDANGNLVTNIADQMARAQMAVDEVSDELSLLTLYIEKMLKSLVFAPDFYYGGIEAMEAPYIEYYPIGVTENAGKNHEETAFTGTSLAFITPYVKGYYHMNPSYYDVNKIKSMSVVSDDKDYVQVGNTRTAACNPQIIDQSWIEDSKDGYLVVSIDLDASKVEFNPDKVTVLAVQAHTENAEAGADSTITSDYAAIVKSIINGIVIADPSSTLMNENRAVTTPCTHPNDEFHIYTIARTAIDELYTHTLVYNDQVGVNLLDLVEAHYVRNNLGAENHMEDVTKYGLEWKFDLSHYTSGDNKTSESVHAWLNGTNIIACNVTDKGESIPGVQDRSIIDREPMVRVSLVESKTGNIVAIGYIKFRIVDEETPEVPDDDYEISFINGGYDLGCDGYTFTLTWAQVENRVLSYLNMSKAEFEKCYTVDKIPGTTNCQLYEKVNGAYVQTTNYGNVVENIDVLHLETTTLTWTVTGNEIYAQVWDPASYSYKQGVSLYTTIRYINNIGGPDVYVTLETGTIATPYAVWESTENKINEYWFSTNDHMSTSTGFDEIHNNVEVVGQTNANDEFNNDILTTLDGNKVSFNITSGSPSFAMENITCGFQFVITEYPTLVGADGTVYSMSVSADGTVLYATDPSGATQEVAILSNAAGDVVSAQGIVSVVSYQHTAFAENILNASAHDELAGAASATVKVFAVNECGMVLPVENSEFDIKFLRPLDVLGTDNVVFIDAIDGGNRHDMIDLVTFEDWRDLWAENYVSYYGINVIEAMTNQITTTLNGGTLGVTPLSSVTGLVKFHWKPTGASKLYDGKDFGYLYYENNGQVVGEFQIRVPVTVTYDWGQVMSGYVDVTIRPTTGQDDNE